MGDSLELKAGQRLLFTDVLMRRFFGVVKCRAQDSTFYVVKSNRGMHLVCAHDIVAVIS